MECFSTTSTVLSVVRVRVRVRVGVGVRGRVNSHPSCHSWALWFWSHVEGVIRSSYEKGGLVRTINNDRNLSAFNRIIFCYREN